MSDVLSDYWTARFEKTTAATPDPVIALETRAVTPLDMQFGELPMKSAPEEIDADLTNGPPLYAVVDASLIEGLPEHLAASGLEATCLYIGDQAHELHDVAPYLVKLAPDTAILRQLLSRSEMPQHWWDHGATIFLTSPVPFDALHAHLRRLLRLQDARGEWRMFRFWDAPLLRRLFMETNVDFPDPLRCFGKENLRIVERFFLPDPVSDTVTIASSDAPTMPSTWRCSDVFLRVLQNYARERFARGLLDHCRTNFPATFAVLAPEFQFDLMLDGLEQAGRFNLSKRGPVTSYMEMRLMLGIGFADDPMYPWAAEILHRVTPDTQLAKANELFEHFDAYHKAVNGPNSATYLAAIARAESLLDEPAEMTHAEMLRRSYPEKYDYLGPDLIQAFLNAIRDQLQGRGALDLRSTRTYILLCFFMGHRCAEDPQYGWIGPALERSWDHGTAEQDSVLVRKARTWVAAVLAGAPSS